MLPALSWEATIKCHSVAGAPETLDVPVLVIMDFSAPRTVKGMHLSFINHLVL